MSAEFLLAVLRVERLRLRTIIADIDVLTAALERLSTKREHQPRRRHSNTPL